jgi:ribulose-phosphate 3-epimerase
MTENPETIIEKLLIKEGDIISIHYESTLHLQRVVTLVKERGARAAVAINPATPISALEEILPELDMVLIMSVNPGFAGQKIVPTSFEKIRKMRSVLNNCGFGNILIEVDGNCSFENVPRMYEAGADIFVVGTSSVFAKGLTVKEGTEKFLKTLNK